MFKQAMGVLGAFCLAAPAAAQGNYFESGNWAAVRMGKTCHVFTLRAARDTSGMLTFSFDEHGFNAGFTYEYHPYGNDEDAPWDAQTDSIQLYIDDRPVWMGEEMFFSGPGRHYGAGMTSGIAGGMAAAVQGAQHSVDFAVDRHADGETWIYGSFSTQGFAEVMQQAGVMCAFDPAALPGS